MVDDYWKLIAKVMARVNIKKKNLINFGGTYDIEADKSGNSALNMSYPVLSSIN